MGPASGSEPSTAITSAIHRETEAARALLAGMRGTIGEEDMALLAHTIEGETNLLETNDTALAEIDETEVWISGLKEKEGPVRLKAARNGGARHAYPLLDRTGDGNNRTA